MLFTLFFFWWLFLYITKTSVTGCGLFFLYGFYAFYHKGEYFYLLWFKKRNQDQCYWLRFFFYLRVFRLFYLKFFSYIFFISIGILVIFKNPIGERVFVFIWYDHMKNFLGKMSIYTATMLASFSEIINFIKKIRNLLYNFNYFLEIDIY